jgi:curli production assembly/transport component CsgG
LLHAGIIVEGGIIGYDTNIATGGVGARFLGIGGDAKYIHDVVTVTLRAVSTKTGEVLTSVTTRKAVASYALQGGAFRYVKLDELFEAEAGVTYNEPKQIAVQSAIERAVLGLIVEGAELGVWRFADPAAGLSYIKSYREHKYGADLTVAAQTPPRPMTLAPAETEQLVPKRPAPVQVTQRRLSPATVPSGARPAVRNAAQPAGQSGVRQVPGVGAVPVERQPAPEAPRQLPPAPTPDEPSLGGIPQPAGSSKVAVLTEGQG